MARFSDGNSNVGSGRKKLENSEALNTTALFSIDLELRHGKGPRRIPATQLRQEAQERAVLKKVLLHEDEDKIAMERELNDRFGLERGGNRS